MLFKSISRAIGATLIITGTAVGAGMLAIPLVTASLGFFETLILLFFCWALMLYTALQILEINLAFPRAASFSTMASKTTGPVGSLITWITICLLLYSLCAAYITGGAALLGNLFQLSFPHLFSNIFLKSINPHIIYVLLFTLFFGCFVFFGVRPVDYLNRFLMFLKLGAFFILAGLILPHVHLDFIFNPPPEINTSRISVALFALPVLMTSFGFHPVIPSIRIYVGEHPRRLRWIIIAGCTLPLFIYVLWEFYTLGVLPSKGPDSLVSIVSQGGSVAQMVSLMQRYLHNEWVEVFFNLFTDVAVTTSFLGVALGLYHFLLDGLKIALDENFFRRLIVWAFVFFIPAAVALFYPQGFVKVLGFAGIFVAILLLILPCWMMYKLKGRGNFGIFFTGLVGVGVIILALLSYF